MNIFPTIVAGMAFGAPELMIILVIVLLLFGGSKLPSLAKGLGQSMKEFKKASKEDPEEEKEEKIAEAKKAAETAKTHGPN
jgi:sec-independent protein translocase protein TatA